MLHELRTYVGNFGKTAELHAWLAESRKHTARHGLSVLGFWSEEVGSFNQVQCLLGYASLEDRDAKWAALAADPEWRQFEAEQARRHGEVVATHDGLLLKAWKGHSPDLQGKLHELRIYEAMPGKAAQLQLRMDSEIKPVFARHGIRNVCYWTDVVAPQRFVYMLGFDSLADREQRWKAYMSDPYWKDSNQRWDANGPLLKAAWNRILRPTQYSPTSA